MRNFLRAAALSLGLALGLAAASQAQVNLSPSGGTTTRALFASIMSTTIPTSAGTGYSTWNNQGTATVADGTSGVKLGITTGNGSAHVLRTRTKTAPTAPYTETMLFGLTQPVNFNSLFVGWSDGTGFDGFLLQQDNAFHSVWTNNTTQGTQTNLSYQRNAANMAFVWVQLKRDSSNNVTLNVSWDGENFVAISGLSSQATSGGALGSSGYSNLVYGIDNFSAAGAIEMLSWTSTSP